MHADIRISSTAVAKGAILRALKKANGPERIIQCSYGFLRDELYDPETHPEHKRAKANVDEGDGKKYVVDTIDWLISAVRIEQSAPLAKY